MSLVFCSFTYSQTRTSCSLSASQNHYTMRAEKEAPRRGIYFSSHGFNIMHCASSGMLTSVSMNSAPAESLYTISAPQTTNSFPLSHTLFYLISAIFLFCNTSKISASCSLTNRNNDTASIPQRTSCSFRKYATNSNSIHSIT